MRLQVTSCFISVYFHCVIFCSNSQTGPVCSQKHTRICSLANHEIRFRNVSPSYSIATQPKRCYTWCWNQSLLSDFSTQWRRLTWRGWKDWSGNIFLHWINTPCEKDDDCTCEEATSSSARLAWCTKPTLHSRNHASRGKKKKKSDLFFLSS